MNAAFDEFFMRMALREAEKAAADGEVPTGCVILISRRSSMPEEIWRFPTTWPRYISHLT